jgi:hypothetical protein
MNMYKLMIAGIAIFNGGFCITGALSPGISDKSVQLAFSSGDPVTLQNHALGFLIENSGTLKNFFKEEWLEQSFEIDVPFSSQAFSHVHNILRDMPQPDTLKREELVEAFTCADFFEAPKAIERIKGQIFYLYKRSSNQGDFLQALPKKLSHEIRYIIGWQKATCTNTLTGHIGPIASVAFSPDGKFLATGSDDNTVKIWDLETGVCTRTLTSHASSITSLAFSPDGKFLATGSYGSTVRIWDPETGVCTRTLTGHTNSIYSVAFSPDGKFLATGSFDKTVKIWDPKTGVCTNTLTGHTKWIDVVAFSPDGTMLATGSGDSTVKIWYPKTGVCLNTLTGDACSITSLAFSPDGKFLATGSYGSTVRIWDPETGVCTRTLTGHIGPIFSVAFFPDGMLATGSRDGTVKIWDPKAGACLNTLTGHAGSIESLAFSPGGTMFATGLSNKTVKIWMPKISVPTISVPETPWYKRRTVWLGATLLGAAAATAYSYRTALSSFWKHIPSFFKIRSYAR